MPRLSLRAKLLASFVVILVPVLGLLVYGYREANERRISAALDTQMRTAQAIATLVDANFDEALTFGWALANDPVVRSLDPSKLDAHLQQLAPRYPQSEGFGIVNAAGDSVGVSTPFPPGLARLGVVADRPYFQRLMATGEPIVSEVIVSRTTLRPTVVLAVPIRDAGGKVIGAVIVSLNFDVLSDRVVRIVSADNRHVVLVDSAGTVAFHTGRPDIPFDQRNLAGFAPITRALNGEQTGLRSYVSPLLGDVRIGAFAPSPKYGWVVGVTEPEDLALAPVRRALRDQLLGFGAVAALSVALAVILSYALLEPIRRLTGHALALGQGDLSRRAGIKTGDELERLGQTFDEMARRLAATLSDLRQSEELYRTLAEAAKDMIFVVNREGYVEYVNSFAASQFGARPDEIVGKRRADLFPSEVADAQEHHLQQAFQTNRPVYAEAKTKFANHHEVWLGTWLVPIETKAGEARAVMGISRDITKLKELDHLKDQFIAIAAHELKTPLAIMKGYAQALLRTDGNMPLRQRQMIEAINRGSDRIDAVVKDLLDISKLVAGPFDLVTGPLDLEALVARCIERVSLIDTSHRIRVVSAVPLVVPGDRERLEQVLMSLLDNATKYSPMGGDIDVAVGVSGQEAVVSVRDHGVGIPKEKQPHVFTRFYSAHAGTPYDFGGMGVGLYISKEIITRHGGRMWFESAAGQGSTFYFSLPLQSALQGST